MRLRLPLALTLLMVMLVTASAAAHGRVFVGAGGGMATHRIGMVPSAVVVLPGFIKAPAFHGFPQAAIVITPHRVIQPGLPVLVTHPSATFFRQIVVVSPSVQGAFPQRVTAPPKRIKPKVIVVAPTDSTHQH
jgi:hypothetical protein